MSKRIALITHEMSSVGGLPTMVKFLYRTLLESGRYQPTLISLATSAYDKTSFQLSSPSSWLRGPLIEETMWHDLSFNHVGVWGSELEFQRYRPRRNLSAMLERCDALQFVVGSAPWARVASKSDRPILIWTATTTSADRASHLRQASMRKRAWSSLMMPITERYEESSLRSATVVFALSEYTKAVVEAKIGRDKVVLAPCGVDTDYFHPNSNHDGNYVLSVARFSDPRKNAQLLIDAFAEVDRRIPNCPALYLVGDPPNQEIQSKIGALGLTGKIRLLGPKKGKELADLYRHAKYFVLSSDEEGLAIVILEAMASGLAAISTDCGGPATAIKNGETGFLTPVGDVVTLADRMELLIIDDQMRRNFGAAGRRVAEERFSLAAAGKIFLDKYDELLNWST